MPGMESLLTPQAMERSVKVTPTDEKDEMVVSMGPQHPSTHGVLRVIVKVNGERITGVDQEIGFLHRCFEKLTEGEKFSQAIPHSDRTDYLGQMANELCIVSAIEQLVGVEVPERAEYIRVICQELNRLASHLMWWGSATMDLGGTSAFLYAWREREVALDLFEVLTGVRMMYNYIRVGGVRNDLPDSFIPGVERFLDDLEQKFDDYHKLVTGNPIFQVRTQGVGILPKEKAIALGASGPMLRGSGVKYDIRKDDPYSIYDRFDFDIPTGTKGDIWDRYNVRMEEMVQSVKILRQAIKDLPGGDFVGKVPRRLQPEGDVYARVEGPRGETGCYLVGNGAEEPYRLHWRAPSFIHLQTLNEVGPGMMIADMVAMIGSLDIILGEVDR